MFSLAPRIHAPLRIHSPRPKVIRQVSEVLDSDGEADSDPEEEDAAEIPERKKPRAAQLADRVSDYMISK